MFWPCFSCFYLIKQNRGQFTILVFCCMCHIMYPIKNVDTFVIPFILVWIDTDRHTGRCLFWVSSTHIWTHDLAQVPCGQNPMNRFSINIMGHCKWMVSILLRNTKIFNHTSYCGFIGQFFQLSNDSWFGFLLN